jgi:hypothetical protein
VVTTEEEEEEEELLLVVVVLAEEHEEADCGVPTEPAPVAREATDSPVCSMCGVMGDGVVRTGSGSGKRDYRCRALFVFDWGWGRRRRTTTGGTAYVHTRHPLTGPRDSPTFTHSLAQSIRTHTYPQSPAHTSSPHTRTHSPMREEVSWMLQLPAEATEAAADDATEQADKGMGGWRRYCRMRSSVLVTAARTMYSLKAIWGLGWVWCGWMDGCVGVGRGGWCRVCGCVGYSPTHRHPCYHPIPPPPLPQPTPLDWTRLDPTTHRGVLGAALLLHKGVDHLPQLLVGDDDDAPDGAVRDGRHAVAPPEPLLDGAALVRVPIQGQARVLHDLLHDRAQHAPLLLLLARLAPAAPRAAHAGPALAGGAVRHMGPDGIAPVVTRPLLFQERAQAPRGPELRHACWLVAALLCSALLCLGVSRCRCLSGPPPPLPYWGGCAGDLPCSESDAPASKAELAGRFSQRAQQAGILLGGVEKPVGGETGGQKGERGVSGRRGQSSEGAGCVWRAPFNLQTG